ncbi:hypothetical protein [Roseimaritima ulvae]|uniref:Uncharacterized protein n=1 Tax=Roseimaritima ulvae TaxID=980254 RepID=A0A5B9QTS1_9BACT|nr:hypothetical protein [Roseimaritima ulvae]QEG41339.1 hypothetical protein UC8_33580 [Roseimaritima ulvae]
MSLLPKTFKILSESDGDARRQTAKCLGTEVKQIYDRWVNEAKELEGNELAVRVGWAKDLLEISSNPEKYGDEADDLLVDAMGIDRSQKKFYRNVARFIDDKLLKEIERFNGDANSQYGRITWSHLAALARTCDPDIQHNLLRKCAEQRWSVMVLHEYVDEAIKRKPGSNSTETRKRGSQTLIKKAARCAENLSQAAAPVLEKQFLEEVGKIKENRRPETIQKFEEAIDSLKACGERLNATEEAIVKAIATLRGDKQTEVAMLNAEQAPTVRPKVKKKVKQKRKPAPSSSSGSTATGERIKKKKKVSKKKPAAKAPGPQEKSASSSGSVVKKKKRRRTVPAAAAT